MRLFRQMWGKARAVPLVAAAAAVAVVVMMMMMLRRGNLPSRCGSRETSPLPLKCVGSPARAHAANKALVAILFIFFCSHSLALWTRPARAGHPAVFTTSFALASGGERAPSTRQQEVLRAPHVAKCFPFVFVYVGDLSTVDRGLRCFVMWYTQVQGCESENL